MIQPLRWRKLCDQNIVFSVIVERDKPSVNFEESTKANNKKKKQKNRIYFDQRFHSKRNALWEPSAASTKRCILSARVLRYGAYSVPKQLSDESTISAAAESARCSIVLAYGAERSLADGCRVPRSGHPPLSSATSSAT